MMGSSLRADAWLDYAAGTRVDHFAAWCGAHLRLGQSQWAGQPLVLEPDWQRPIMAEATAVNADLTPYWKTVGLVVPRKCAKTTTLGAFATYSLAMGRGDPEILLAAGSDKQADKLYRTCTGFVRRSSALREMFVPRDYIGQIARRDGDGTIYRLSNKGDTQHGANPSLVVIDELAWWRTPTLRNSWGALTTADGARNDTQVFFITTEGEAQGRDDSILGEMVDGNEAVGDVEHYPGLTISRDHESRQLIFHYHAVDAAAADPRPLRKALADVKAGKTPELSVEVLSERLLASVMPANPASWITDEYILGQAKASKVMPSDFLQLHACVAAESRNVWIPADRWAACEEPEYEIPEDTDIYVAVDASISHDSTAVAWCAKMDDDRIGGMCHVWSARDGSPAHEFVDGGRIRFRPVESFISDVLNKRWRVAEIVYDPRFFEQSAQTLSDDGFLVASMNQQGVVMRGAEQSFHDAVMERHFIHGGDAVLSAHVAATVAEKTDVWKIRKAKQSAVIDATVAMVMAHSRALQRVEASPYEERGVIVL